MKLRLQLTETIPENIEEGVLYVSLTYWTTAHKCGCGCGQKVVLRLSPKHWAITLNGDSVSMYPSIGNWQLPCRSHYWIDEGRILHARGWSDAEITRNRLMTKGKRTPYQTPRSRHNELFELEGNSDITTQRDVPYLGNDPRAGIGEIGEDAVGPAGRSKNGTKAVSTRWRERALNAVRRIWQKNS